MKMPFLDRPHRTAGAQGCASPATTIEFWLGCNWERVKDRHISAKPRSCRAKATGQQRACCAGNGADPARATLEG